MLTRAMKRADAPDRRGTAWGLEEKRTHQPKASADNQPQTLDDFEQPIC